MFIFSEPTEQPWVFSQRKRELSVDQNIAVHLKTPDITAINFLHQNFNNKFRGSVLNEEDGFSTQLQVSAFFNLIFKQYFSPKQNFWVLVITPGYLTQKWSEKLEKIGGLKVKMVDFATCPADFDQENGLALLLSFEDIKLAEVLIDYNLFSIVIDHFDVVATKLVIKKLWSDFNIGITTRNFYRNPDQKLQWTMLNWVNPNSVGRLMDYYEADSDNFANLRDNYHHWWLTLTWEFCETFKRNVDEGDESQPLQNVATRRIYKRTKRKSAKPKKENSLHSSEDEVTSNGANEGRKQIDSDLNQDIEMNEAVNETSNSSQDTIEYDLEDCNFTPASISNHNAEECPDRAASKVHSYDDDDVLMGIINGTGRKARKELDHQSQVNLKKEELYSQIFNDVPVPDRESRSPDSSEAFLLSLV